MTAGVSVLFWVVALLASPVLLMVAIFAVAIEGAGRALKGTMETVDDRKEVEFVGGPWDGATVRLTEPSPKIRVPHTGRITRSVYALKDGVYIHEDEEVVK